MHRKITVFKKIKLLFIGIVKKFLNRKERWFNLVFKNLKLQSYDVAVGFRQSPICFYLATRKVCAKKKIGFWHGDIDYMGDVSGWTYFFNELDSLACVSNAVGEGVANKYPDIKEKVKTVYNYVDVEQIKSSSNAEGLGFSKDTFNIVTVARVSFEDKMLHRIPEIAKKLVMQGCNFVWRIVGDGKDFNSLRKKIADKGLEDAVILCGQQQNPYGYMKQSDLFVLTSKTESFGMVVLESLICNTPVVAGEYPALKEIIEDGVTE